MTVRSALGWVARTVWSSGSRTGLVGPPRLPNRASRARTRLAEDAPVGTGPVTTSSVMPRAYVTTTVRVDSRAATTRSGTSVREPARPAGRPARPRPRSATTVRAGLPRAARRRPRRCHRSRARRRRAAPARRRRRSPRGSRWWRCRTRGRRTADWVRPGSLPALRTGTNPMPSSWASGGAEDEAPGLDADDEVDAPPPPVGHVAHDRAEGLTVGEQRGDVLEQHPRAREVRDVAQPAR